MHSGRRREILQLSIDFPLKLPTGPKGKSGAARYVFADLFCGAGGLAFGFVQAGFRSVFAVDSDKAAASTYRENFGHDVWDKPIEKLAKIPVPVDIIVGGPPCQGFSRLGQMSPRGEHHNMNRLWRHYVRLVEEARPLAFVVENVPEFLKSREFEGLKSKAAVLGYKTAAGVLNAVHYGVPQQRRRAFVIASRIGNPILPNPQNVRATVRDVIENLPLVPDGTNLHIGRNPTSTSAQRYRCIPPGGNRFDLMLKRPDLTPRCWKDKPTGSTDVFGRLEWDKPALTIRTEFFKPEKGRYLHPEANRPLTHREAARLQTFPDDFQFCGSKIEIARQIGNAVPPLLAKAIADTLRATLQEMGHDEACQPARSIALAAQSDR